MVRHIPLMLLLCYLCPVDWVPCQLNLPPFTEQTVRGMNISAEIFLKLGNTGSVVHRRWSARIITAGRPVLTRNDELSPILQYRHPDPKLLSQLTTNHPELQVKGSWSRLKISDNLKKIARESFASFIWNRAPYPVCSIRIQALTRL